MKKIAANSSGWNYLMEKYPRSSKVSILVIDSKNLFSCGGAVIPTFMWAVEKAGRIGDSMWSDFSDPVLNIRSYFDNRSLEQLLLVDNYFNVEWHLLGKESEILTSPAGFENRFVHKDFLALYRHLFSSIKVPDTAVIVPSRSNLDADESSEQYIQTYKDTISSLRVGA